MLNGYSPLHVQVQNMQTHSASVGEENHLKPTTTLAYFRPSARQKKTHAFMSQAENAAG